MCILLHLCVHKKAAGRRSTGLLNKTFPSRGFSNEYGLLCKHIFPANIQVPSITGNLFLDGKRETRGGRQEKEQKEEMEEKSKNDMWIISHGRLIYIGLHCHRRESTSSSWVTNTAPQLSVPWSYREEVESWLRRRQDCLFLQQVQLPGVLPCVPS